MAVRCDGYRWEGNLRERDHLEDLSVDGGITLKLASKK
jgi:hypothetical protein